MGRADNSLSETAQRIFEFPIFQNPNLAGEIFKDFKQFRSEIKTHQTERLLKFHPTCPYKLHLTCLQYFHQQQRSLATHYSFAVYSNSFGFSAGAQENTVFP